jgi:hypothetical protein
MSERCIEALVLAQQEAEFLASALVGTEHVLVGLLSGRNLGAQVLAEYSIDVAIVRATLEKFRTREEKSDIRRFSWRVRRAVESAFEEAARSGSPFVNTDHLYLGILGQEDAAAARILADLEVPLEAILSRLRSGKGTTESDPLFAADLLDQLPVTDLAPPMEQVTTGPGPMTLDQFLEVLDELSRALQSAQRTFAAARPRGGPLELDIPDVAPSEWPVVDEEVYQIAGLVRQILSQAVSRGARRVVFLPCEGALRVEYHHPEGTSEAVEIPAILRTVVPFKVMRMARLNPMEKGRELEGSMTFRLGDRFHDMRVRSEPILKGLRVEVSLLEAS